VSVTEVRWNRRAILDVASIHAHVADHNPRAADDLRRLIYRRTDDLAHFPLAHRQGRLPGTREMVLHPNYILIYRLTGEVITILRVLHSARNWP